MKTTLIVTALMIVVLFVHADRAAESADTARGRVSAPPPATALDLQDGVPVGDRYLVPWLPSSVVDRLPAAEAKEEQYLSERIALAELVVRERILTAEDLATTYAHDLPGFAEVLVSDGFRQDADGTWYYDRFESWMRFPLHR